MADSLMPRPAQITASLVRQVIVEFVRQFPDDRINGSRLQRFARQLRDGEIACDNAALLESLREMGQTLGRTSSWDQALGDVTANLRFLDPAAGTGGFAGSVISKFLLGNPDFVASLLDNESYRKRIDHAAPPPENLAYLQPFMKGVAGSLESCGQCRSFCATSGDEGECRLFPREAVVLDGKILFLFPKHNQKDWCTQYKAKFDFVVGAPPTPISR